MRLGWLLRCLPGFSIIGLLAILASICGILPLSPASNAGNGGLPSLTAKAFILIAVFVYLNVGWFVVRTSLSLVNATREACRIMERRAPSLGKSKSKMDRICDSESVQEVTHAIIVPSYCEDITTLQTTLAVLAGHPRAQSQYAIYLAMELKETEAAEKSEVLISEFQESFLHIQATFHPADIPGEAAGKGSNVNYAAQHISLADLPGALVCDVIVTVIDADTHLWQDYFTEIRRLHYIHGSESNHTIYTCPNIFDRNSSDTPFLVHCMDISWALVCHSTMFPRSPLPIPVSVYSLPLSLVEATGGWDVDHTAIGEDFHMMLKCYFKTNGALITRQIYTPASQCNISSSSRGWRRQVSIHYARYQQGLRHMWGGTMDIGYALRQGASNPSLVFRPRSLLVLCLLYEAYLEHCQLLILQVFSTAYMWFMPSTESSPLISWGITLTQRICLFNFAWMCVCVALYHRWYSVCLDIRKKDMAKSIHPSLQINKVGFSSHTWWHPARLFEPLGVVIASALFASIPLAQSAFSQFWTDKLVYQVSKKPVFDNEKLDE